MFALAVMACDDIQAKDLASTDPATAFAAGVDFCLSDHKVTRSVSRTMIELGYETTEWGSLVEYWNGTQLIYISNDHFCDVQTIGLSTEDAVKIVKNTLSQTDILPLNTEIDAPGCLQLWNDSFDIIVQSAGQDPICGPIEDASFRINYGEGIL